MHTECTEKHGIAQVFEFFRAFNPFAFEVLVYYRYQLFYEIVTVVFVNVPIEKGGFPNALTCFIKNPAQSCFVFDFY